MAIMNVSRRRVLQVLPVAAAAPLAAQESPAAISNADIEAVRASLRGAAQVVRQVELPQSTEPAVRFVPRG